MEQFSFETPQRRVAELQRSSKIGARIIGRKVVGAVQTGLDIAHTIVGQPTYAKLEQTATINQVNGCYERGFFFHKLDEIITDRESRHLNLTWIDIIGFAEQVNNPHGHTIGDKALSVSGWAIRSYFRNPVDEQSSSLVGSWGGDEFVAATVESNNPIRNQHHLFAGALRYYTTQNEIAEHRVELNLKQLRVNMESTGSEHGIDAYSNVHELVDLGIDNLEYRYQTISTDIDGAADGRYAVDKFVREYSKKGSGRSTQR